LQLKTKVSTISHPHALITPLLLKARIIRKNKNNQACVVTGSCNITKAAYESNQENAIVLIDTAHIERFIGQFQALKSRSYTYKK